MDRKLVETFCDAENLAIKLVYNLFYRVSIRKIAIISPDRYIGTSDTW